MGDVPEAEQLAAASPAKPEQEQEQDTLIEPYYFMVGGHMFHHPGESKERAAAVTKKKHHERLDPMLDDELQMFNQIDADNDGFISANDLFKYMKNNNFPRFKGTKKDMKTIQQM